MKKLSLIFLGVCLLAPAAFAKKKNTDAPQTVPSDVYAKYDKNANGVLDPDEKEAVRKDFAQDKNGPLKIYDLNNDGKLSDDEIAAIPATKLADPPAKKRKKNQ